MRTTTRRRRGRVPPAVGSTETVARPANAVAKTRPDRHDRGSRLGTPGRCLVAGVGPVAPLGDANVGPWRRLGGSPCRAFRDWLRRLQMPVRSRLQGWSVGVPIGRAAARRLTQSRRRHGCWWTTSSASARCQADACGRKHKSELVPAHHPFVAKPLARSVEWPRGKRS